jgi:hypothetical protein
MVFESGYGRIQPGVFDDVSIKMVASLNATTGAEWLAGRFGKALV